MRIVAFGFLLLFASLCEGRSFSSVFSLSSETPNDRIKYIAKFGCNVGGACRYRVRAKLVNPDESGPRYAALSTSIDRMPLQLRVVLDEDWDKYAKSKKIGCDNIEKAQSSTFSVPVYNNGRWSDWAISTITQTARPHFWYFLLDDCKDGVGEMVRRRLNDSSTRLDDFYLTVESEFYQTDQSHLSYEEMNAEIWQCIQVVIAVCAFAFCLYRQSRLFKGQTLDIHIIPHILNGVLVFTIWSLILRIIFVARLMKSGIRSTTLETLADCLFIATQIALSFSLITVASGVTLKAKQALTRYHSIILLFTVSAIQFAAVYFGKSDDDVLNTNYILEGFLGNMIVLTRIGLWVLFIWAWRKTAFDKETPRATSHFLKKWFLPATLYFLSLPIIKVAAAFLPSVLRAPLYFHASFGVQIATVLVLAEIFLVKGEYFEVSLMSQSMLPLRGNLFGNDEMYKHLD